jgi:hypothetical protein
MCNPDQCSYKEICPHHATVQAISPNNSPCNTYFTACPHYDKWSSGAERAPAPSDNFFGTLMNRLRAMLRQRPV